MRHLTLALVLTGSLALNATGQDEKITWVSFEDAVELNKENPRKFFVDFYTSWCGWCKRLDAVTFQDPEVVNLIDEHYYAVKFDAEQKEAIEFGDKSYEFVKPPNAMQGYHELAATIMQWRMSYPTMVILEVDESASKVMILTPIVGYVDGTKLEPILQYLGEDMHIQKINWEEFRANYVTNN